MSEYAFPFGDFEGSYDYGVDKSKGITLRDYFAIRVMQTIIPKILSKDDFDQMDDGIDEYIGYPVSQAVRFSYYIADCMLEAKSRKSE